MAGTALALALATLGAGCASGARYFEPTERVQGQTVEGYRIALYPMLASGSALGEAKVWSNGARLIDGKTRVRVTLEVHNTSAVPLTLGPNDVRLDVRTDEGEPLSALSPLPFDKQSIPPGALGRAGVEFEMPLGLSPRDVTALRLHWRVVGTTVEQIYAQRTPFVRERIEPYYATGPYVYPCWPYGPIDCAAQFGFAAGVYYGVWLYEPVIVPYAGPARRVSRVYPKR